MELVELKYIEETASVHLFTITVEQQYYYGGIKTETIDCAIPKTMCLAYRLSNGEYLTRTLGYSIGNSIEAILGTKTRCYKKRTEHVNNNNNNTFKDCTDITENETKALCNEGWLSFVENIKLFNERCTNDTLIQFDNGDIIKYGDVHPSAILVYFKLTNN